MTNLHKREFANCIVDLFEDWLEKKGIRVENAERDAEDPDNAANIYGDDYDDIMDGITGILHEEGIEVAADFNEGIDGNELRIRNEFNAMIADKSDELPEVGCFNVYMTHEEMGDIETQGDKPDVTYTWREFCDWLLNDIKEMVGDDISNVTINDIEFAGTDNMCE